MKQEKETIYRFSLTSAEQRFVVLLKEVKRQLDEDYGIFNCPENNSESGCPICPFKDDNGRSCPFLRLDDAIDDIVTKANKIEKGEVICPQ